MDCVAFEAQWVNSRVADPSVIEPVYSAVALVKQFMVECHNVMLLEPLVAHDFARPNSSVAQHVTLHSNQNVVEGDILVLRPTINYPLDGAHMGIATGNGNSSQIEIIEQNGATGQGTGLDGDAIRTRYVDRILIEAVVRPIMQLEVPEPELNLDAILEAAPDEPIQVAPPAGGILNYRPPAAKKFTLFTDKRTVRGVTYVPHEYRYWVAAPSVIATRFELTSLSVADILPELAYQATFETQGMAILPDGTSYALPAKTWGQFAYRGIPDVPIGYPMSALAGSYKDTLPKEAEPVKPVSVPQPAVAPQPVKPDPKLPPAWQRSWRPYEVPVRYVIVEKNVEVFDLAAPGKPVKPAQYKEVFVYGEFRKNNVTYARLRLDGDDNFTGWYGIPFFVPGSRQPLLIKESDLYDMSRPKRKRITDVRPMDGVNVLLGYVQKYTGKFLDAQTKANNRKEPS